jgi:N-acyl-D-aspartate/D-glutamate deacylase
MLDFVIRNALIIDGLGNPPRRGDLGVLAGRIAAVGGEVGAGRHELDAAGRALAPGIIDNHTHYDAQITWDPTLAPSPALGVTTAIIGNCGFTIAPCKPADRDLTMRHLTHVEGMSLDALRRGVRWEFESFPDYFDMLERNGFVPNVAGYVGHSSVRSWVMGAAAVERAASAGEVQEMRAIVADAMRAGAIGFATSTSPAHNGEGGTPMPSRLADERELRALVGAVGDCGHGVFMLTKGGQTRMDFLESLAQESGRPVVVAALLHNRTNPDAVFQDMRAIAAARKRGNRLHGAVSACVLTFDFTLADPYPLEGLQAWQPALAAKAEGLRRTLADADFRGAIKDELARPATFRIFNGEWEEIFVVETRDQRHRWMEHRSLAELGQTAGKHPLDLMLDLALDEDLKTVFVATTLNSDESAVGRLILDEHSLLSLSDAGAHLTFFCDAGFGLHVLGHWVRERQLMPLEMAVRKLTSVPADLFGMSDRGRLASGAWADLLLFDPATVGRGAKERVFDLPGGAPRLTTPAIGVYGVWVNGVQVADESGILAHCGRPGKLLRKFEN